MAVLDSKLGAQSTSLMGWFRADSKAAFPARVGDEVWADVSNNKFNLDSSNNVYTAIVGPNGKPVSYYDGSREIQASTRVVTNLLTSEVKYTFGAFKATAIAGTAGNVCNNESIWCAGSTAGGAGVFFRNIASTDLRLYFANFVAAWNQVSTPVLLDTWYTFRGRHNSTVIGICVDDIDDEVTAATAATATWGTTLTVGYNRATIPTGFDGQIGELLFYNRVMTDAESRSIMAYLASKWQTSRGDPHEQARDVATRRLWMFKQPVLTPTIETPRLDLLDLDLFDTLGVSHPTFPCATTSGAGAQQWAQGDLTIKAIEFDLDALELAFVGEETRRYRATYAESNVNDVIEFNERRDGMAVLAVGASSGTGALRVFERDSIKYLERGDDGNVAAVRPAVEGINVRGLSIETSNYHNLLNNVFASTLTSGWTTGSSGATLEAITSGSDAVFDSSITANCCKLSATTSASASISQSFSRIVAVTAGSTVDSPGRYMTLSIDHKDDSDYLFWWLQNTSSAKYWNGGTLAWTSSGLYPNTVALSTSLARESFVVNTNGAAAGEIGGPYTLGIGPGTSGVRDRINRIYCVSLDENRRFSTSRIANLVGSTTALGRRSGDKIMVSNDESARVWSADHGTLLCSFLPEWNSAVDHSEAYSTDVNYFSGPYATIAFCYHSSLNYAHVYYGFDTSQWVFQLVSAGTSYSTTVAKSLAPITTSEPHTVAARWIGTAGELGFDSGTIHLFVDGVGSSGTAAVAMTEATTGYVLIGNSYIDATSTAKGTPVAVRGYSCLEGYLRHFEIVPLCLSSEEISVWGTA